MAQVGDTIYETIEIEYTEWGEYVYHADFLVSFGERSKPTNERDCFVNRIWGNDQIIYNKLTGLRLPGLKFKFYPGTQDQGPISNGLGYRGLMVIKFRDLPLKSFDGRLPTVSAEIIDGVPTTVKSGSIKTVGVPYGFSPVS